MHTTNCTACSLEDRKGRRYYCHECNCLGRVVDTQAPEFELILCPGEGSEPCSRGQVNLGMHGWRHCETCGGFGYVRRPTDTEQAALMAVATQFEGAISYAQGG